MGAYLDQIAGPRVRPGDRHVGHDPEPRRAGVGRRRRRRSRSCATGGSAPRRCTGCASGWSSLTLEERLAVPGLDPRRADLSVAGVGAARHHRPAARRRASSRSATWRCAKGWSSTTSIATARASARSNAIPTSGGAASIELGERCGYWSEHAQQVARLALAIFDQTRSVHGLGDRERDWLEYGALLHDVGVHISYERHHRHSYYLIKNGDLRGFDPAGDRDHRADRALSPPGDAEEIARGLRRSARQAAPHGQGAVGDGAARRRARSQPLAGARRHRSLSARRRLPGAAAHHRRRRARAVGRAPPRRAARSACSASRFASRSPAATTRNRPRMLNNLTTPHEYPGKLFVVEGHRRVGKDDAAGAAGKVA